MNPFFISFSKMLYLEDYLEMIEHLPQELRDRFTEMREMDLQVQNAMDSLDTRVKEFFIACKKMKQVEREAEYEKIDQDYYKALEDADEKVHIANQIYELVDRYIRKLDQELQKFKMELEADNAGITQILEQRSYDLDKAQVVSSPISVNSIKTEKRKHSQLNSSLNFAGEKQVDRTDRVLSSLATEVIRETISSSRVAMTGHSPSSSSTSSSCSTNSIPERNAVVPNSKGHPFGGGNALAAAASQAIAATQQSLKRSSNQSQSNLIQQGRRSASLKASYEAINSGLQNLKEFNISARDVAGIQSVPASASSIVSPAEPKTKTKKTSRTSVASQHIETSFTMEDSEDSSAVDESNAALDWAYDPNEPRYCICNQVSYGDMVACDNTDCPFEWFHYPCVGITQPPKGKWYCPQCTSSMKRRGRKDR